MIGRIGTWVRSLYRPCVDLQRQSHGRPEATVLQIRIRRLSRDLEAIESMNTKVIATILRNLQIISFEDLY